MGHSPALGICPALSEFILLSLQISHEIQWQKLIWESKHEVPNKGSVLYCKAPGWPQTPQEAVRHNATKDSMCPCSSVDVSITDVPLSCECSQGGLRATAFQLFPMVAREGGCSSVWLSATSSLPVLSKALARFSSSVQVPRVMLLVSRCLAQCVSSVRIDCNVFAEWRHKLRLSHRMQCSFEFLFTNRALFHFIK